MNSARRMSVTWRASSYSSSNGGECVEIGEGVADVIPVRDSKAPHGPALSFQQGAFSSFVSAIQAGELDTL